MFCCQGCQHFARAEPTLIFKVSDRFTERLRRRAASLVQCPRTRLGEGWLLGIATTAQMIWTYIGGKWQTTTRAQRRLDVMDEWPTHCAERLRLFVHDSTTETAVWVQNSENSGKK